MRRETGIRETVEVVITVAHVIGMTVQIEMTGMIVTNVMIAGAHQ
jgi:hypothetical protein